MSDKDQHTPMYSSSDIEKYLNGELSAPEMHALERAALDDPFLADALDGIMIHRHLPEQPSFQEDMAQLKERLQNRVAEKSKTRVRPLFMRYAAAVILLVGLGLAAYYTLFNQHKSQESLAVSKVPSAAPATVPPPAAEKAQSPADTQLTEPVADKQSKPGTIQPATSARPKPTASGRKKDEEISTSDAVASNRFKPAEQPSVPAAATPSWKARFDTLRLSKTSDYITSNSYRPKPALSLPANKLVFSGKVTDPYNNPLPGAYLALKNNQNINAVTDKNGFFNIQLNNKMDTGSAVVVNHVGYEQGSMFLNTENKKGNFIQLQPQSSSLNEVVIVGYGSKRKEIMRQNIDAENKALSLVAVPAAGWPAYKEYLESKKQSANLDSTLRGDETISFIVNKKGELSSFKVERSISPAHDSATIQMIRQGPAWQLLSGKKARARVILTY